MYIYVHFSQFTDKEHFPPKFITSNSYFPILTNPDRHMLNRLSYFKSNSLEFSELMTHTFGCISPLCLFLILRALIHRLNVRIHFRGNPSHLSGGPHFLTGSAHIFFKSTHGFILSLYDLEQIAKSAICRGFFFRAETVPDSMLKKTVTYSAYICQESSGSFTWIALI